MASLFGRLCGGGAGAGAGEERAPSQPLEGPVPGLYIVKDAVSEAEEAAILEVLDADKTEWIIRSSRSKSHSTRVTRNYGYFYTYKSAQGHRSPAGKSVRFLDVPTWAARYLAERVKNVFNRSIVPSDWNVNQVHVSLYRAKDNHRIRQHNDCQMGKIRHAVVGVSLGDQAVMAFENPNGDRKFVKLPRRSAYAMTGDALEVWTHGIRAEHNNGNRLSITLRHVDELFLSRPVRTNPDSTATANMHNTAQSDFVSHRPSERGESILVQCPDETTTTTTTTTTATINAAAANSPLVQLRKEIFIDVPQKDVIKLISDNSLDTVTRDVPQLHPPVPQ